MAGIEVNVLMLSFHRYCLHHGAGGVAGRLRPEMRRVECGASVRRQGWLIVVGFSMSHMIFRPLVLLQKGVIAFMLLSSSLPFYGKNRQHVAKMVLSGKFGFKGHRWKPISTDAKDFVVHCLVTKASKRQTAHEMMKHSFIVNHVDEYRNGMIGFAMMDRVQATIQTYCRYEKVKKLGLLVIAHKVCIDSVCISHDDAEFGTFL